MLDELIHVKLRLWIVVLYLYAVSFLLGVVVGLSHDIRTTLIVAISGFALALLSVGFVCACAALHALIDQAGRERPAVSGLSSMEETASIMQQHTGASQRTSAASSPVEWQELSDLDA